MRKPIIVTLAAALGSLVLGSRTFGQDFDKLLKEAGYSLGDAIGKALKEAGGGVPVDAELESENGKLIYTVDVAIGAKKAEINLDAKTGALLEKGSEDEDGSKIAAAAKITLVQAIETALKKAAGKAVAAGLKMEGDQPQAIVKVFADGKVMAVTINAVSGEVIKAEAAKAEDQEAEKDEHPFTDSFGEDDKDLASTGTNPFFVLEPGFVIELKGGEAGKETTITITVLNDTKKIANVETRAVEEKEVVNGQLKEITRDYFAISKRTNNVYYFGEDVDEYKDGKVSGHGGSWLAGEKGARYGLYMAGVPLVGSRYCQEIAPGVAMDRAEIVSLTEKFETPAGKFENVIKTMETSGIEKGEKEIKHFARGIGVIQDDICKLVKYGMMKK